MIKRMMLMMIGLSLLLMACGGAEPEPEPTAVPPTAEPTAIPPTEVPTEEPTPEPDLTADFVELDSQVGGYNLRHPADWEMVDFFGMTLLGTDEGVLENPEQIASGAVSVIMAGPRDEMPGDSLVENMEMAAEEMNPNPEAGEATIIEEPVALTINGLEAAQMVMEYSNEAGDPLTFVLTLIADETHAVTLIGLTPSAEVEQYAPIFKAMADTMTVFEPTAEPELGGFEEVTPEENSESGNSVDAGTESVPGRPDARLAVAFIADGSTLFDVQMVAENETVGWTFSGLEGELLDVEVVADKDVLLDILDGNGDSILPFGEIDRTSSGGEAVYFLRLPATDTYSVVAYEFVGAPMTAEVQISSAGTGTLLQVIDRGEMSVGESRDYQFAEKDGSSLGYLIPFMADAGTAVDIVVTALDDSDLTIAVWDAFGDPLTDGYIDASGSGGVESVMGYPIIDGGLYFVSVREYFANAGSFNIAIGSGSGDVGGSETAVATTSGGTYILGEEIGTSLAESTIDVWTFDGVEGDIWEIIASPFGDLDLVIDVIQVSTGQSVIGGELDNAFGEETVDMLRIPASDTYQITIRSYSGDAGEYTLSSFEVDTTAMAMESSSGTVAFGTAINGTVAEDDSVWIFSANGGDMITVAVQPLGDFDVVLEIFNSKGVSITEGEIDEGFGGTAEIATLTISETDEYTIILRGFAGNGGEYVLTVVSQ